MAKKIVVEMPSAAEILKHVDADGKLAIRAMPHCASDAIELPKPGGRPALIVRVTAAADEGRANDAVIALVAKSIGRPKSAVTILRGETSRDKLLKIER